MYSKDLRNEDKKNNFPSSLRSPGSLLEMFVQFSGKPSQSKSSAARF